MIGETQRERDYHADDRDRMWHAMPRPCGEIRSNPMYEYSKEREQLFTDTGQRMFLAIRDRAHTLMASSGAVRMDKLLGVVGGDTWQMMACVDRMVELGELIEITPAKTISQYRVFMQPIGD